MRDHDVGARPDDFSEWVRPHVSVMTHLAARLAGDADADDIVQESLTRAWRRRSTFDPQRGTPRTWLLAIVADQARRSWQRRRSAPHRDPVAGGRDVDADLDLRRAVAGLAPRQRLAVELHYYAGLSVEETAAVMGCAEGTVKATLSQARGRLRDVLGEEE